MNAVRIDDGAQMVVVLTIKEISYLLVSLFDDLVGPLMVFIFVTLMFFGCAVCFNSAMA